MRQEIVQIALVVKNYDEAIRFYTEKLGFQLVEDTQLSETKRWVRIRPAGSSGFCLLLAQANSTAQKQSIGNQTGGRVFLFLHTDNFDRDFKNYTTNGVEVVSGPREEEYGKVAVIKDLYGNLIDLIEPKNHVSLDGK
ncbi:MAG: VOC family protein [Bacteroidota bacterium]